MYTDFHLDPPLNGAQNMAIDEDLFHRFNNHRHPCHIRGEEFCSVRIYEWSTPTLSYGLAQENKDIFNQHLHQLKSGGWETVARITGGRVVLHHREITYSVVGSVKGIFGNGLHSSYDTISSILGVFLKKLGLKPDTPDIPSPRSGKTMKGFNRRSLVCYDALGFKEISLGGRKLIGSAQKRGKYAFLQHGSIPYYRHDLRVEDYLRKEYLSSSLKSDPVFLSDYIDLPIEEAKSILLKVFVQEIKRLTKLSIGDEVQRDRLHQNLVRTI